MRPRYRSLLFTIALVIALYMVWRKVRIVFLAVSVWQLVVLLLVIAVIIFLLLDHLFNRSR